MKRFGTWMRVGCNFLKFAALYTALNTIVGLGSHITGTPAKIPILWIGTTLNFEPLVYFIFRSAWHLTEGFAHSFLLWAAGDVIELVFSNAAYTRAVYATLRKQSKQTPIYVHVPTPEEQPKGRVHHQMPPLFEDYPTVPISQSYQPQTIQRAPMRRVTVFRDRAEHQVRPPRPAGTIEVVDSLDGESINAMRTQPLTPLSDALPFDEVS